MEAHIKKVLVYYIETCRKKLSLPTDHAALVIFDRFKGQYSSKILSLLDTHHITLVIISPNCTERLQPLDISVNKAVKENLRKQFQNWYSSQVSKDTVMRPVDLSMSVVKPLGATWLINTFDYIKTNPLIVECLSMRHIILWGRRVPTVKYAVCIYIYLYIYIYIYIFIYRFVRIYGSQR